MEGWGNILLIFVEKKYAVYKKVKRLEKRYGLSVYTSTPKVNQNKGHTLIVTKSYLSFGTSI